MSVGTCPWSKHDDEAWSECLLGRVPGCSDAKIVLELTQTSCKPSASCVLGTSLHSSLGVRSLGLPSSLNAGPFFETHSYECACGSVYVFSSDESIGVEGRVVEMRTTL